MVEDLNTSLSPMLIGIAAVVAVVCFVIGRLSNAGAKKREESLKRDVLDAKASVPQLESGIRNRDQQISRLQEEIKDLNDRSNDLLRRQDAQNNELRRAQREVKNLTSELNAVRGVRRSEDNLVMDGFEDEAAGEPGDSPVVTQLKKTEALYDKLKGALIKRDERIEELERLLQGERPAADVDAISLEASPVAELKPLENRIGEQAGIIETLQEQLSALRKEKEMLEDLASRRSKSNRALKDATAEIEARVPELEKQIGERDQTIVAREASIKRLLGEVETAKSEIATRDTKIETLHADLETKTRLVETSEQRENALKSTIAAREERLAALDQELATTLGVVRSLEKDLETASGRITAQQSAVEKLNAEIARRQQAETTLTGTIRDRDFRIDALTADKQALEKTLAAAREAARKAGEATEALRHEAADSQRLFEKHQEAVTADRLVAEREAKALRREIDDLQSNLKQHQQWMEKLKGSLEEKENRSRENQRKLEALRVELETANEQLKARHEERQTAEDARHALEREIVSLTSRDEHTRAELAEHVQTLSVYKSMLADREFRIDALEQQLAGAGGTTASAAPGDAAVGDESPPEPAPADEPSATGTAAAAGTAPVHPPATTNLPVPYTRDAAEDEEEPSAQQAAS